MYLSQVESPAGMLYLAANETHITQLTFAPRCDGEAVETPLLQEARAQLEAYFAKTLRVFDLPLAPRGTDFQTRVWRALGEIPYGETWSYKDIAIAVDSPRGYRAVGLANNRNPISIFIPCHRVIGSGGALTGYGGGLSAKEFLLTLEDVSF